MSAHGIQQKLKSVIEQASLIDTPLEKRSSQIYSWVKNLKPGSLIAKPHVVLFLKEFILDAEIWLDIKYLVSQDEQNAYLTVMTPTEKYWYCELFSKWLSENDQRFLIWRRKLMSGEFRQEDGTLINDVVNLTKQLDGTIIKRYIADLSMATDIIASSTQKQSLCIQLTSMSEEFSEQKSNDWEKTLIFWGIERGLFLSYNPGINNFVNQIATTVVDKSDNIPIGSYLKLNL